MEAHSQPLASAVHLLGCRTAAESHQRLGILSEQNSMDVSANIINGEEKNILPYALPKAGSSDHSTHSPQTGIKCSFLGCRVFARNMAIECELRKNLIMYFGHSGAFWIVKPIVRESVV